VSKKKLFGHEKKPFDLQQKKLPGCFAPICHTVTIYTTRDNQTIAKIGYMVKVFANTMRLPGSNPSHKNEKKKRKRKRTVETWFVSRHYEPRTEVRRGGTPKVRKL
jgi:hypothetical protein